MTEISPHLKMLPRRHYVGVDDDDPIRFYHWPVIGPLYRRRVELCLAELRGGDRILEVGFGSGVTFINLHETYKEIHGLDLKASTKDVMNLFKTLQIETHLRNGSVLHMPYADRMFDSVLLISILEHLKPGELPMAFQEIRRVLRPGGQVVYGVPVERPLIGMVFQMLGYQIRDHHFSTQKDVAKVAHQVLKQVGITSNEGAT